MAPYTPPEARQALLDDDTLSMSAPAAASGAGADEGSHVGMRSGPPDTPPRGEERPRRLEREERPRRLERIAELGRGGSGRVWLVYDHERRHELALKHIMDRDPDHLRRFKRSFRALSTLHHPNLVNLYEIGEDEEGLYLLMEAVHGVPLLQYLRGPGALSHTLPHSLSARSTPLGPATDTERLPHPAEAVEARETLDEEENEDRGRAPPLNSARFMSAIRQLLAGLHALHEAGQVHRDLKPANVMVTRSGQVKLLDFGIVATAGQHDPGSLCGTTGFVPPEALRGANPAPAADIYALGVLLHQAWTGRLPFRGDREAILRQTLHQHPAAVRSVAPWVPEQQAALMDRMLSMDPDARPILHEIRRAFDAWSNEPGQAAAPVQGLRSETQEGEEASGSTRLGYEELIRALLQRLVPGPLGLTLIEGPRNEGKERVFGLIRREAMAAGHVVLHGIARPGDRVPFSAFDEITDHLGQYLRHVPDGHWSLDARVAADEAATLFPGLRRAGWTPPPDAPKREDVFAQLARVLEWVGRRKRGLLILIEDLHFADADCLDLIEGLLRSDMQHVQLVASAASDRFVGAVGPEHALQRLCARHVSRLHRIALQGADEGEILGILRHHAGAEVSDGVLQAVAKSCEGDPVLARSAGRMLRADPTLRDPDALWERRLHSIWGALDEAQRDLLVLCLAANHPLTFAQACACLHTPFRDLYANATTLKAAGLLEQDGASAPSTRIRLGATHFFKGLQSLAGRERIRLAFHALSENLRSEDAINQVRYLRNSGQQEKAAALARQAALEACDRAAYHLASELFELASLEGPMDVGLLRQWIVCLEACGRYGRAARLWQRLEILKRRSLAQRREGGARRAELESLRQGRIAALLADNQRDAAMALIEEDEEEVAGEGRIRLRIAGAVLRFLLRDGGRVGEALLRRSGLGTSLKEHDAGPKDRLSQEGLRAAQHRRVRLGLIVSHFDPGRAIHMLVEGADIGRARGDGTDAIAHMTMAYLASHMRQSNTGGRLSNHYRQRAEQAALALREPNLEYYAQMRALVDAHMMQRSGRWAEARTAYAALDDRLEQGGETASFLRVLIALQRGVCALLAQDIPALSRDARDIRSLLEGPSSHALAGHARFIEGGLCGLKGKWSEGVRALSPWLEMDPAACRTGTDAWGMTQARIRSGFGCATTAEAALPHIHEAMRYADRFHVLRQITGPLLTVPAALLEVKVLRAGLEGARVRRIRRLVRPALDGPPGMGAAALRCLAYLADQQGHPERAIALLRESEALATRLNQPLCRAVAHYQLGRRTPGLRGDAMMVEGRRALEEAGSSGGLLHEDPGPAGGRA